LSEIIKMWCDHGEIPAGTNCQKCFEENPRNWEQAQTLPEEIKPLTEAMKAHHRSRFAVLDDYKYPPRQPGEGLMFDILNESGRISSATPHTSSQPKSSSREFSKASTTDTIVEWKGTLGGPPGDYKNKDDTEKK
jgi:hypothetical protein